MLVKGQKRGASPALPIWAKEKKEQRERGAEKRGIEPCGVKKENRLLESHPDATTDFTEETVPRPVGRARRGGKVPREGQKKGGGEKGVDKVNISAQKKSHPNKGRLRKGGGAKPKSAAGCERLGGGGGGKKGKGKGPRNLGGHVLDISSVKSKGFTVGKGGEGRDRHGFKEEVGPRKEGDLFSCQDGGRNTITGDVFKKNLRTLGDLAVSHAREKREERAKGTRREGGGGGVVPFHVVGRKVA